MKAIKILFILFFCNQTVSGQNKSRVQVEDLPIWHEMYQPQLTPQGDWLSYVKSTDSEDLHLMETTSNSEMVFKEHKKNNFSHNGRFVLIQTAKTIEIGDLKNKKWESHTAKEWVGWIGKTDEILWKHKDSIAKYNVVSQKTDYRNGLISSFISQSAKWVVYTLKEDDGYGVYVLDLGSFKSEKLYQTAKNIIGVHFDPDSDTFGFAVENEKEIKNLVVADRSGSSWKTFDLSSANTDVRWDGYRFFIDGAGKNIYFYMAAESTKFDPKAVETISVRKSLDDLAPTDLRIYYHWNYGKNKVKALKEPQMDDVLVTHVPEHYIAYTTKNYDIRDNSGIERADFYLLAKGSDPLLIEKEIALTHKHFIISSNKPYIIYYKNGFWWSYHLIKKIKKCLHSDNPNQFENFEKNYQASTAHYHVMGFSDTKNEVWLYDKNDLWVLNLDGKYSKRITNGREKGLVYRHVAQEGFLVNQYHDTRFRSYVINESENKLVSIYDPKEERWGLAYLDKERNVIEIRQLEPYRHLWAKFISKDKVVIKKVNNETPGMFEVIDIKRNLVMSHQSNKELKEAGVQKSELIHVKLSDGHQSRGALFYPVGWQPEKKYPLVVYVYEKTATKITEYVPPTWSNSDGFNRNLLNHNGYFVLYVDLRYAYDQLGKYLANDINQIIDKVIATEPSINESKIGLFGHSFGGYEVMFLVGQTNRFKAAVAGAGVSDLYDMYYGEKDQGSLGIFVVENVQFRTRPAYENPKFDLSNPIKYVDRINTPMLIWSGKNDRIIRKEHSIKMYLALWRQKKEATLIIYENDHHFLEEPENQKDLTLRILDFYDSKLK